MIVASILASLIAGSLAAFAAWLTGYGFGRIALAYWTSGTFALLLTPLLHVVVRLLAQWWWRRSIPFRFSMILIQSGAVAVIGVGFLLLAALGPLPILLALLGLLLVLLAPAWLSYSLDAHLAPPIAPFTEVACCRFRGQLVKLA